jgi:hypothetical protein
MKLLPCLLAIWCSLCLAVTADTDTSKDVGGKLDTLIPGAIQLIEGKKYEELLNLLVEPDRLAKIKAKEDFAKFVVTFGEEKAPQLLGVLKYIKDVKPEMNEEGTTASYKLPEEIKSPRRTITFKLIEKRWHLQN